MKICLLLFALLLGNTLLLQAQVVGNANYKVGVIKVATVRHGRYSNILYTVNGEPLTTATVKALLKTYPPSATELRKWRAQKRLALLIVPVFASATIIGGLQVDKQKNSNGSSFSKAPVPFSISVGTLLGLTIILITNNHFEKAVEAYNSQFN